MFSSSEEVLRFVAEENVEFIDVRFVDLPGTMQHFTVPAASFGEGVFTDGLMFDGSSAWLKAPSMTRPGTLPGRTGVGVAARCARSGTERIPW